MGIDSLILTKRKDLDLSFFSFVQVDFSSSVVNNLFISLGTKSSDFGFRYTSLGILTLEQTRHVALAGHITADTWFSHV